jgi:2-polyprenyl-6-methoxyphenol hydroxylase-like FAD-dependent oxidoreductase
VIPVTRSSDHAVVVGASISGILAAKVLAGHLGRVTLVDRDEMPRDPVNRGGVPQGRHVHGLLSRGLSVIESMFPGTTDDLVARGAILGDAQEDGAYVFGGHRLAAGAADLPVLAVSRPLLEWYLRQRLLTDDRIQVLEHTSVLDLSFSADDRRVNGAIVSDRDGGPPRLLAGRLVVDASGRGSRTPEWVGRRGFAPPPEEVRRIDKQYASREFRRTPAPGQPVVRAVGATRATPRGGIILAAEGDRWMVSLSGINGERPPLELPDFRAWARSLVAPDVADALEDLTPVGEGARYRFPANRRRRYERLALFPEGLLVIGDALCAFDPVFGQGMTVAAVEAEELDRCLAADRPGSLARRFHQRCAEHIDTPWTIAAGDTISGNGHQPLGERIIDRYVGRLVRAAESDPVLAAAFLRVNHLVEPPSHLMRPPLVARVLRASMRSDEPGPRRAATPASVT